MSTIRTRGIATPTVRDGEPGSPIEFTLSTPGRKRDGIRLDNSRIRTENFKRNPVAPWLHGRDPTRGGEPIGRWARVFTRGTGEDTEWLGEIVFDQEDEFARRIESKYRRGFLNAVSISWATGRDDDGEVYYDLLEVSPVPVPADPDAVILGRDGLQEYASDLRDAVSAFDRVAARVDPDYQPLETKPEAPEPPEGDRERVFEPIRVLTRDAGPLSHTELDDALWEAVKDHYGRDADGWYAGFLFAVYDDFLIARVCEPFTGFNRHPYTVSDAGEVEIGEATRVFMTWTEAPAADDDRSILGEDFARSLAEPEGYSFVDADALGL